MRPSPVHEYYTPGQFQLYVGLLYLIYIDI